MRALIAAVLLSSAASAEPLHLSLSAGEGHNHALLGARLEVAGEHWGAFGAAGYTNLRGHAAFAGGARWTAGERRGLVLSLHGSVFRAYNTVLQGSTLTVIAATVGYRLRHERLWVEAAIGPALFIDAHHVEVMGQEYKLRFERQIGFGALGGQDNPPMPDIEAAFGIEL